MKIYTALELINKHYEIDRVIDPDEKYIKLSDLEKIKKKYGIERYKEIFRNF